MSSNYQILPPLLSDEFEALKTSIAEQGVDVPIIVDQEGNIIDGYHRQRACDDLGIFCPREVRHFQCETDKLELALTQLPQPNPIFAIFEVFQPRFVTQVVWRWSTVVRSVM